MGTPGFYFHVTMGKVTHLRFEQTQEKIEQLWRDVLREENRQGTVRQSDSTILFDGRAAERDEARA